MEKIELSTQTICYPMPCSLVGVNVGGKPNTALGDVHKIIS